MENIEQRIAKIKSEKRLGLMTHIIAGYPTIEESKKIAELMIESNVDFIEIQIPFTDPMADGPTMMEANKVALDNGIRVKDSFDLMTNLSKNTGIPILFMTYFNIVHSYGVEKFCIDAKQAGASGLIIPDMPIDEESNEHLMKYCEENSIVHIKLLSPASTVKRIEMNSTKSEGFLYYVSRKGITGSQTQMDSELEDNLKVIKKFFHIPVAVGFGISKPEHVEFLKGKAEIAIVGSAVINEYKLKGIDGVDNFLKSIKSAL